MFRRCCRALCEPKPGLIVVREELDVRGKRLLNRTRRVKLTRARHRRASSCVPTRGSEHDAEHAVCLRIAVVEFDGLSVRRLCRWPVPVEPELHCSKRRLRLGEVRAGLDRARSRVASALPHLVRRRIAVNRARGIGVCQASPRERVVWIEQCRAPIVIDGLHVRRRRQLIPEVAAAKVEVVRLAISRLPEGQGAEPLRRELLSNLPGDTGAQRTLQLQQAFRLVVVGLCPDLNLVAHANQLRGHAQSAALGLNGPFD